jgi:UDP-3-O-[3-hydroxymyristoyl] glucosamine N-acyltransferase
MKLRDIAAMLNAEIDGSDETEIRRVAKIEEAQEGDISFVANPKYQKFMETTHASALIVAKHLAVGVGRKPVLLRVDDPYVSFLKILQHFHPLLDPLPPGIHPTAVIAPGATLGAEVRVGAYVVIGERVRVGEGTMLSHHVVLGDDVQVGEKCLLYPGVAVYAGCRLGSRVIIHAGTVIGSDGFGFAPQPDGSYEKIPQLGVAVIEDDVEIGANCTVDRATLGETRIKRGVKLDNLIQVAHNVVIGENTVSAAQAGISGSTKIGSNCMIGGQVGFTGHLTIADGTKVGAQSGVHRSVEKPHTTIFGSPAYPQREAFRMQGAVTQLPDLLNTVRDLRKRIELLEAALAQKRDS